LVTAGRNHCFNVDSSISPASSIPRLAGPFGLHHAIRG
jgi:hypothetical protein